MGTESTFWYNNMILTGMTDKRGMAWHYLKSAQGAEPNHYAGAIPVEDVKRRLFDRMRVVEGGGTSTFEYLDADGKMVQGSLPLSNQKTINRPAGTFGPDDEGEVIGTVGKNFRVHGYNEWLLGVTSQILDSDLIIASAGLLKGGAVAWVQAELSEDNIVTPEGVAFRPFVTAATAVDGSMSSTWIRGAQAVVCDNTLGAALREAVASFFKVRHTSNSDSRMSTARDVLGIVYSAADDFSEQVRMLCETEVTDKQWEAFLDQLAPRVDANGEPKKGRTLTLAENKRDALSMLYKRDERAATWHGNAFGVLQAVNTWATHIQTVKTKGGARGERNYLHLVQGEWNKLSNETMATLDKVLTSV